MCVSTMSMTPGLGTSHVALQGRRARRHPLGNLARRLKFHDSFARECRLSFCALLQLHHAPAIRLPCRLRLRAVPGRFAFRGNLVTVYGLRIAELHATAYS